MAAATNPGHFDPGAVSTRGNDKKTVTVVNPVNRCPTVIVSAEEVERFEAELVSQFGLAKH